VLLFRTIADLQSRRPRALRPALTSRDIGRLEEIPLSARGAFDVIAQRVEHSFFGGRLLNAADFAACRNAYVTFASPASWALEHDEIRRNRLISESGSKFKSVSAL
jgi:hypothetical protein